LDKRCIVSTALLGSGCGGIADAQTPALQGIPNLPSPSSPPIPEVSRLSAAAVESGRASIREAPERDPPTRM